MYPFSQAVPPAVRTHLDAQTAYMSDMSKSMFRSFQRMCELNIQLMQAMLEEGTLAGKQMFSPPHDAEAVSATAPRVPPAGDRLRAYQHHVSRLAADTQVELARVTEQHAQNTTRTARAMADEVARGQQDPVRRFADSVTRGAESGTAQSPPRAEVRGQQATAPAGAVQDEG